MQSWVFSFCFGVIKMWRHKNNPISTIRSLNNLITCFCEWQQAVAFCSLTATHFNMEKFTVYLAECLFIRPTTHCFFWFASYSWVGPRSYLKRTETSSLGVQMSSHHPKQTVLLGGKRSRVRLKWTQNNSCLTLLKKSHRMCWTTVHPHEAQFWLDLC